MVRGLEHLPCKEKLREVRLERAWRREGFRWPEQQPSTTYKGVIKNMELDFSQ